MEPRLKADEICRKMLYELEWNFEPSICKAIAKKCALIAVEEVINSELYKWLEDEIYWQEVKQEVEKL